jgi:hypothetical protein
MRRPEGEREMGGYLKQKLFRFCVIWSAPAT